MRMVFQGVHMLLDAQPDRPWGDDPRRNQLVLIGRNLDEQAIREGFEACLLRPKEKSQVFYKATGRLRYRITP